LFIRHAARFVPLLEFRMASRRQSLRTLASDEADFRPVALRIASCKATYCCPTLIVTEVAVLSLTDGLAPALVIARRRPLRNDANCISKERLLGPTLIQRMAQLFDPTRILREQRQNARMGDRARNAGSADEVPARPSVSIGRLKKRTKIEQWPP
jgi:hypothetical protein